MDHEADIEPVTAAAAEEQKIDNITVAIKNVIKKSLAVDGKYQLSKPKRSVSLRYHCLRGLQVHDSRFVRKCKK